MTHYTTTADEIIDLLLSMQDEKKSRDLMRFFKTGKGDYGEGDRFLGIVNPKVRSVVKEVGEMELAEIHHLLLSEWHEIRLCGFLVLVGQFERLCKPKLIGDADATRRRDEIVTFYLAHAERANNWDLVDLSVHKIIGRWLLLPTFLGGDEDVPAMNVDHKTAVLDQLAASDCLWKQRMSVVATWMSNRHGEAWWCQRYAVMHLHHRHDLMHKAVGWMLREMGKHCDMDLLRDFLGEHCHEMSRTTLRYAIERMAEDERKMWLSR